MFELKKSVSGGANIYIHTVHGGTGGIYWGGNAQAHTMNFDRATGNVTCPGTFTSGSDQRLKDNVEAISVDSAKHFVAGLNPVTYNRNDPEGTPRRIGLIVQEVKAPTSDDWGANLAAEYNKSTNPDGGGQLFWGLDYARLTVPPIKVI